jgi:hypothetical protein
MPARQARTSTQHLQPSTRVFGWLNGRFGVSAARLGVMRPRCPSGPLDGRPRSHGGIGYATNQGGLKAEESEGSRGGVGSGRNLCVAGGRRVSGKRGAVATHCTERRNHAQRGGSGRCQLGDILHLRKGGGTPSRYSTCGRRLHGVRRLRGLRLWMRVRRCHSMLGVLLQGHSGGAVIFRQACARRLEVVEVEEAKIALLD